MIGERLRVLSMLGADAAGRVVRASGHVLPGVLSVSHRRTAESRPARPPGRDGAADLRPSPPGPGSAAAPPGATQLLRGFIPTKKGLLR